MRRTLLTALILGLVVGAVVAPAAARTPRKLAPKTKTADYDRPTGTFAGTTYTEIDPEGDGTIASFSFDVRYDHVRLSIADDSGASVYGTAHLGTETIEFCGATDGAVRLPRGRGPLTIELWSGHCPDMSTPSVVTAGTITAKFFDRR